MGNEKNKIKVMLVDNDEDEIFFMEEGFNSTGLFNVIATASDGEDLISKLTDSDDVLPEIIVSDLNMPGKNGIDIVKELKLNNAFSGIRVIIISTSSSKAFEDSALGAGAHAYFVKPELFTEYAALAKKIYENLGVGRGN